MDGKYLFMQAADITDIDNDRLLYSMGNNGHNGHRQGGEVAAAQQQTFDRKFFESCDALVKKFERKVAYD